MKTLKQKIKVMQAALDGVDVERSCVDGWVNFNGLKCHWDWINYDYRIKEEPLELIISVFYGLREDGSNVYQVSSDVNCAHFGKGDKTIKMREVQK